MACCSIHRWITGEPKHSPLFALWNIKPGGCHGKCKGKEESYLWNSAEEEGEKGGDKRGKGFSGRGKVLSNGLHLLNHLLPSGMFSVRWGPSTAIWNLLWRMLQDVKIGNWRK